MNTESQFVEIENKIAELVSEDPDYFVVEVSVKPTNNIKVFVDADHGATIDRLTKLNKALYKWIEENLFPNGDFSIEVSSPGLEEPLKLHRQYVKNIGRPVQVLQNDGIIREGKLLSVSDTEIVLEVQAGKGKKKPVRMTGSGGEMLQYNISFENIKSTKIQIKF